MEVPVNINLPPAELGNISEIEKAIKDYCLTPGSRDLLAKFIMSQDYVKQLIPLVQIAEDLEGQRELQSLCSIMKSIIMLNDTTIIEHVASDECIMGVVGALEYDPDFPFHKANHRQC